MVSVKNLRKRRLSSGEPSGIKKCHLSSEEPSGNVVVAASRSSYFQDQDAHFITWEDCPSFGPANSKKNRTQDLYLYDLRNLKKYDILLCQNDSPASSFRLFRFDDEGEARVQFEALKHILIPLLQVIPQEILLISSLQKICDVLRQNSTWNVAHIVVHLGYIQAFSHPDIQRKADVAEIEMLLTPLHLAIQKEDLKMIKTIMKLDVNVDATDCRGNSIFHTASTTNAKIIKLVASKKSKLLNAQNCAGKTPLHLACEAGKPDCVKALLVSRADVKVAAAYTASIPIYSAIESDSISCVREIVKMYPNETYGNHIKTNCSQLVFATSPQMIYTLVELRCKVNWECFNSMTSLHYHVQQDRLSCVIALLSCGASKSWIDNDGNTPLHYVMSPSVLQALLAFGADASITNKKGENVRHSVATRSGLKQKNKMLYILHAVGAPRCSTQMDTCSDGCSPNGKYDGEPPEIIPMGRSRTAYDDFLDEALNYIVHTGSNDNLPKGGRVLCLDGGGMKVLILLLFLRVIERESKLYLTTLFDWICGTSFGGILALCIAMGKSSSHCLKLFFRMKDKIFMGQRPYDPTPLENILKKEFGESTRMAHIKDVKVAVTGVLGDRFPADLHLFRNYEGGEELLHSQKRVAKTTVFEETKSPEKQLVWEAAMCCGAATSYFSSYGRFLDGGLISNNPTLDMLTEITEHNAALKTLGREKETEAVNVVVSLGTGKPPVSKVNAKDVFRPESSSNTTKLLIDQATMAENRSVDRARAWCGMCGISYLRLSPQLSVDVQLDETRDEVLVNMLWEALVFLQSRMEKIRNVISPLKENYNRISWENGDITMVEEKKRMSYIL